VTVRNGCKFLGEVTNGDIELQAFLQRAAGYALTGSTREHAMFFTFGRGANGKGVFLNTLTGILGGYATIAAMETFTASNKDRHTTDIAMLRGARMVAAQETEEGRRWAEARITSLTGGDPITARFMRQDDFTYIPQFKLFFAGNHKPGLRSTDEAIRRRLHLIPFNVTIAPDKRDHDLTEKLKAEWPGILQWAIDGCLDWQGESLKPPYAVWQATSDYLKTEDLTMQWLMDSFEWEEGSASGYRLKPNGWLASSVLFGSWKGWAEDAGERVGSPKSFAVKLESYGFVFQRLGAGVRGFKGPKETPERIKDALREAHAAEAEARAAR
jgi:putative DNA primase/helicase